MNNVVEKVLPFDYCCGCGVCSAVCPHGCLEMKLGENGEYRPVSQDSSKCTSCGLCLQVCPYSGEVPENEETLGLQLFPEGKKEHSDNLGQWDETFCGATNDEEHRLKAPSGGLATSLLCALLDSHKIDGAIVAKPSLESPWFQPTIAYTPEEIRQTTGSVYHVMTFGPVLREILQGPEKRYAIVALPCVVKALRLAQKKLPRLKDRLPYIFSLTCGGCNCLHVADLLCVMLRSRKLGLKYRSKTNSTKSPDFRVTTFSQQDERQVRMLGLFGFLWINHVGQLKTCGMCDDLFGMLADATFMDAWLEDYFLEPRGTNLLITRNPEITELLKSEIARGAVSADTISPELVLKSQEVAMNERAYLSSLRYDYEKTHRPDGSIMPCKRDLITRRMLTKEEKKEAVRRLRFHEQTRKYLAKMSRYHSNPDHFYPRIYVYRVFWKVLCSLIRNGLLEKTLHSLKFAKDKRNK